ncbi:MAG TPA: thymidine phosphorylase [Methylomirabilota bacterium]|nr:thymidine phosphorylase [Methylomirabilota bacterium]
MNFLSLIESKRDGVALTDEEIAFLVREFTAGRMADCQMSAFLMAVVFRGLSRAETRALTLAMRDSGEVLTWPAEDRPVVDKHSTGGVGDKVSMPLAPLLACLGFRVPMISGRGLGITGGTLDKLESIPGLTTALAPRRIVGQVQSLGVAMAGQTETMVPADKKLYALRDVTGTVPSVPLITASILSKKLAEGIGALVLDVKFGTAAFMATEAQARELADALVALAGECGLKTAALLSDMSTPLGRTAGNWLEVKEAVECLAGRGPADLRALVIECAAQLLQLTGRTQGVETARRQAAACLDSGAPLQRWESMLTAQGADLASYRRLLEGGPRAPVVIDVRADRSGQIMRCDAKVVGQVVRDLGGGRLTPDATIDVRVGVDEISKPGETVAEGGVLCRVHASDGERARRAAERLRNGFEIV